VSADEVPAFLRTMHQTVRELSAGEPNRPSEEQSQAPEAEYTPAVSVRKSLGSKDHIVSLIDGKPYKTLRRHLSANGLTPEQYRERYKLRPDYPMVARTIPRLGATWPGRSGLGARDAGAGPRQQATTLRPRSPSARAAHQRTRRRNNLSGSGAAFRLWTAECQLPTHCGISAPIGRASA
jgi:predicted transcriptional regulator